MTWGSRNVLGIIAALVATVLVLVLRLWLRDLDTQTYLFFLIPVSLAAWYGGVLPASVSLVVALLVADYFLEAPLGSFTVESPVSAVSFMLKGIVIIATLGALRRTQSRLKEAVASSEAKLRLAHAALSEGSRRELAIEKGGKDRAESALKSTEEKLRQAQKMEAVGRLAGGVAHDFNNLLSIILSYSSLAGENLKVGDPLRGDLEQIKAAGERAAELTHQLLAFSRRQVLQPKVIDPNEIIRVLEPMLRRVIGEDVELLFRPSRGLGCIKADPNQVEQILMNLVVNARDAMPTGGHLIIETGNVELDEAYAAANLGARAGAHVMVAVTDTGSGMDRETQTRIFDPFFTTKEQGKGTGLGLSTVFGIVQQSGGSVWVDSEPGQGTTFKVYMPRCDERVTESQSIPGSNARLQGSETILFVEDEAQLRAVGVTILKRAGYRVLEAKDGREALQFAATHDGPIHLAVTDVVMPELGGRQVAERLAKIRPETKVLFMSGYTDDVVVLHGLVTGEVEFLQKPLRPHVLLGRVRTILDAVECSAA